MTAIDTGDGVRATQTGPVLRLEDVSKTYGSDAVGVTAVSGVSITLDPGELVLIMGPSGSGKTTLLQISGGLLRPSDGKVWLDGTEITALSEKQLPAIRLTRVGFVFQGSELLSTLNVLENVRLVMEAARRPRAEADERGRALLVELGMEKRASARPATLSGGEKQRVAVARALANDPPLILADEPTGSLDSKSGAAVMGLLAGAVKERNKAVLCVTHDHRVREFADRVLWIEDGRLGVEP